MTTKMPRLPMLATALAALFLLATPPAHAIPCLNGQGPLQAGQSYCTDSSGNTADDLYGGSWTDGTGDNALQNTCDVGCPIPCLCAVNNDPAGGDFFDFDKDPTETYIEHTDAEGNIVYSRCTDYYCELQSYGCSDPQAAQIPACVKEKKNELRDAKDKAEKEMNCRAFPDAPGCNDLESDKQNHQEKQPTSFGGGFGLLSVQNRNSDPQPSSDPGTRDPSAGTRDPSAGNSGLSAPPPGGGNNERDDSGNKTDPDASFPSTAYRGDRDSFLPVAFGADNGLLASNNSQTEGAETDELLTLSKTAPTFATGSGAGVSFRGKTGWAKFNAFVRAVDSGAENGSALNQVQRGGFLDRAAAFIAGSDNTVVLEANVTPSQGVLIREHGTL